MSDPQPDRLKPRPRRAEPLQPDRPGRGDNAPDAEQPGDGASGSGPAASDQTSKKAAEKLKEQTDTALENVSKGYD